MPQLVTCASPGRSPRHRVPLPRGVVKVSLVQIPRSSQSSRLTVAIESELDMLRAGLHRAFQGIVSSGVVRAAGFETVSDRRLKQDIVPVSTTSVLDRLMRLPVATWRFAGTRTKRMGPMAQDFRALFGLGEGETSISLADSSGVALAAIQGLNAIVQAKERHLKALEARILALESMLQAQAPSGVRRRPSR